MPPILPSPRALKVCTALMLVTMGCKPPPPPVAPGEPIPAEPDIIVGTMNDECGALVGALEAWKRCPNLDALGRREITWWRDAAEEDGAAADKAKPDDRAQHAIALACRRAINSVRAATERCGNGRPVPAS
jgi:hypothetical protein